MSTLKISAEAMKNLAPSVHEISRQNFDRGPDGANVPRMRAAKDDNGVDDPNAPKVDIAVEFGDLPRGWQVENERATVTPLQFVVANALLNRPITARDRVTGEVVDLREVGVDPVRIDQLTIDDPAWTEAGKVTKADWSQRNPAREVGTLRGDFTELSPEEQHKDIRLIVLARAYLGEHGLAAVVKNLAEVRPN